MITPWDHCASARRAEDSQNPGDFLSAAKDGSWVS